MASKVTSSSRVLARADGILIILFPLPLLKIGRFFTGNTNIRPSVVIAKQEALSISSINCGVNTFEFFGKMIIALPFLLRLIISPKQLIKP